MRKALGLFFVCLSVCSAPPAVAGPGTAKKAGGIVLLSAGSAVAGLLMFVGMIDKMCDSYDAACDRSQKEGNNALLAGAVLLPASIVGGIMLIREGKAEQRFSTGLGAVTDRRLGPMPAWKVGVDF